MPKKLVYSSTPLRQVGFQTVRHTYFILGESRPTGKGEWQKPDAQSGVRRFLFLG